LECSDFGLFLPGIPVKPNCSKYQGSAFIEALKNLALVAWHQSWPHSVRVAGNTKISEHLEMSRFYRGGLTILDDFD
jgi:hypothetical protein